MTKPVSLSIFLALQGVSFQLPDGRILFTDLHEQFDHRHTGLVGRNGIGKSLLARILAGELTPTTGACLRSGSTHYLAQQIAPQPDKTVADLAGVRVILDALHRIEAGSARPEDFDIVGERWTIHQQLQQQFAASGLDHLRADTPAAQLSGGEAMRVSLAGAFLSGADWLILDEPSNHLDRDHRRALIEQLQRWPRGLIVVSHDRALLEAMDRIVELSNLGLRSYGGGYSFYAEAKAQQREQALQQLEQRKTERRREDRELTAQRQKLERRQARGTKQAAVANEPAISLGLRKSRSEASSGKLRAQQESAREKLSQRVREAAVQVEDDAPVLLFTPGQEQPIPDRVAELTGVVLPYGCSQPINLRIRGAQRIALVGPNGSGKSTLLKVLAGQIASRSGRCEVFVETVYLDQQLSILDPEQSILDQMLAKNGALDEAELRTRLALLGLNADHVLLPTRMLSGGERLKAALASVLYSDRPAQLLLLDEPSNHLDLASVQALVAMIRQYRGALIVVSHDEAFLGALDLADHLQMMPR